MEYVALAQFCVLPKIFRKKIIKTGFIIFFFELALIHQESYLHIITLLYKLLSYAHI